MTINTRTGLIVAVTAAVSGSLLLLALTGHSFIAPATIIALTALTATIWIRKTRCSSHGHRKRWLPELDDWSHQHNNPNSGVWAVTPPCGYGHWDLFAPGATQDGDRFYTGDPFAQHAAREDENGNDGLPEIRKWLLPWVETVSGGVVTDVVEGWCAPYGPDLSCREYAIYLQVSGGHMATSVGGHATVRGCEETATENGDQS